MKYGGSKKTLGRIKAKSLPLAMSHLCFDSFKEMACLALSAIGLKDVQDVPYTLVMLKSSSFGLHPS